MLKYLSHRFYRWTYYNITCRAFWWFDDEDTGSVWQRVCYAIVGAAYRLDFWANPGPFDDLDYDCDIMERDLDDNAR